MSWRIEYALLILISTVSVYFLAILLERRCSKITRSVLLIVGLLVNFGILFVFKYFNFFVDIFSLPFNYLALLLPVGISFYTFQASAYLIDVYRKDISCEKSFVNFALFVSFFPQLVAGPIERAADLLPQFKIKKRLKYDNFVKGFHLMLWGYFLKVVIADRAALYVDAIFSNLHLYSGSTLLIAIYFFAFQILCDFAGYSYIAVGAAKFLGFDLSYNFRRPYFSKSISEFWRRWHITLYNWFRDYIYIPLGGNRVGRCEMF